MKTPERWRALPRHALFASTFGQKSSKDVKTSRHDATWRHDVVPWRHMTSWCDVAWRPFVMTECTNCNLSETSEITFFNLDLWPMTLTFELIRDIKVNASTKYWVCMSNGSAVRVLTDRHTHTHGRNRFYTLDRWRGREWIWGLAHYQCQVAFLIEYTDSYMSFTRKHSDSSSSFCSQLLFRERFLRLITTLACIDGL